MSGDQPDINSRLSPAGTQSTISVLELKRLLFDIRDSHVDVCVRFRMIGELWQVSHHRVLTLTDKGVVLQNESNAMAVVIPNIADVMQFELDKSFRHYQPHFHYTVTPAER